jgi:hypothetical protein
MVSANTHYHGVMHAVNCLLKAAWFEQQTAPTLYMHKLCDTSKQALQAATFCQAGETTLAVLV